MARGPFSASEPLTIPGVSTGLTAATLAGRNGAFVTVEDAPIRVQLDGTAPTANDGHLINPGDSFDLESPDELSNFRAIRTGSVSATLQVSYSLGGF